MSTGELPLLSEMTPTISATAYAPLENRARKPLVAPPRLVSQKSPAAFRTISEVAGDLALPQHVLRFWETKFQQIRPIKGGGGRRYYSPDDIKLISNVKELLYTQGFTIKGVQKLLKEAGRNRHTMPTTSQQSATMPTAASVMANTPQINALSTRKPGPLSSDARQALSSLLGELHAMRDLLRQNGI